MNWLAFFIVIAAFVLVLGATFCIGLLGDWLERRLGLGWSIAIVLGGVALAVATAVGVAA